MGQDRDRLLVSDRLSAIDAFFVAHQEASGVPMHLEAEVTLQGPLDLAAVEQAARALVRRWPRLARPLRRRTLGLAWSGRAQEVASEGGVAALRAWREGPIDPFREPPFGVLWVPGEGGGTLALRAHHALADGEAFLGLGRRLLDVVAQESSGSLEEVTEPPDPYRWGALWSRRRLGSMTRHLRALRQEARADDAARLAVRSCGPGPVEVHRRVLEGDAHQALTERARAAETTPAMYVCAAWVRAIGRWNQRRLQAPGERVTVEVPISARGGPDLPLGNRVAPLVLVGRASDPVEILARGLREQLRQGIRARAHLAVPLLTAPGALLPYSLYRRLAADDTWSGFATTHFTWIDGAEDLAARLADGSQGRLALTDLRLQTPVCLHMGAGLLGLSAPGVTRLFVAYRQAALAAHEAAHLVDLFLEEALGG